MEHELERKILETPDDPEARAALADRIENMLTRGRKGE